MKVIADVEANGLTPTTIHCLVCKDIETGDIHVFRDRDEARVFAERVTLWVGHNFVSYDQPVLDRLWGIRIQPESVVDTLVCSRLFDSTLADHKKPHSIEAWGWRLGCPKKGTDISDWSAWTQEMQDRCVSDVEINYLLYKKFEKFIASPLWKAAVETEHFIARLCLDLHNNGFAFDKPAALELKSQIEAEVLKLDEDMKSAFGQRVRFVREYTPRLTKFGTISKNSVPRGEDLTGYNGGPFSQIEYEPFSARSHKQRIERLWEAGWQPVNKSKTHREAEKEYRQQQRKRRKDFHDRSRLAELAEKLKSYEYSGWMTTDEENLSTLPHDAPPQFQKLARFVMLSNRVSTLESWLKEVQDDGRVRGSFNGIGTWTQRMSHDRPNLGNVPKFDAKQPHKTPYSDTMRSLWRAGGGRYLVGVDAESIQLRIFGHYLNDKGFIDALVSGTKETASDPHSLNQKALGAVCKSRDDAKTFIYAWLLGAGIAKIAAILGCSTEEAREANDNFIKFYPGLEYLKRHVIPVDASVGYFKGLDGRFVRIWGDDEDSRAHFALAGYLQNGEAVVIKRACQLWYPKLQREKIPFNIVNLVHDEIQLETIRDLEVAKYVATAVADSIRQVGIDLNLNCPLAGSILNSHGELAVGDNWMVTH